MPDAVVVLEAVLEVVSPDGSHRSVPVAGSPFLIGRGGDNGNHLQLDDRLVSRQCAAIVSQAGNYYLEDRGNRHGLYINDQKIDKSVLADGDVISFGPEDTYKIIFHVTPAAESVQSILTRMESLPRDASFSTAWASSICCWKQPRFSILNFRLIPCFAA